MKRSTLLKNLYLFLILFMTFTLAACQVDSIYKDSDEKDVQNLEAVDLQEKSQQEVVRNGEERVGVLTLSGFMNFFENGTDASDVFADFYMSYWEEHAFAGYNVRHIPWDSARQVAPQMEFIKERIVEAINDGVCQYGCILVSHSTGGLIKDILLSESYDSRGTDDDFSAIWDNIILSIDLASATGGTGVGNVGGDAAQGLNCALGVLDPIKLIFRELECGVPESLGVGYDLMPQIARSINRADDTRTVALLSAGNGTFLGNILKLPTFGILGTNDGLVGMHTACGSNKRENYESCVPYMNADGLLKEQAAPSGHYADHYPIMMTREGHMGHTRPFYFNADLVTPKTESLIEELNIMDVPVQETSTGFWFFKKTYQHVKNSTWNHIADVYGSSFQFDDLPEGKFEL